MTWTTTQIAEVARLWRGGHSAGHIASVVGRSRNAVMGVVHRQDMVSRKTQTRIMPAPLTPEKIKQRSQKRTATMGVHRAEFLGVSLLDLTWVDGIPADCRYPQGDGPFVFCGQEVQQHSSYCPEHHMACYGRPAATPEQIDRARKARAAKNRVFGAVT